MTRHLGLKTIWLAVLLLLCSCPARAQEAWMERPVLRVGVMRERPPISFTYREDPSHHLRGAGVELARLLNEALRKRTEFHIGKSDELFAMMERGEIDYICGLPSGLLPPGVEVQTLVTSFATTRRILVSDPAVRIISELDYSGRRLALLDDSETYMPVARSYGAKTSKVRSYEEGFTLLASGEVEAFVVPSGEIASYLALMEGMRIHFSGLSLERFPTLIVLPPGQVHLKSRLSGELVRLEEEGRLEELRERWYKTPLLGEPSFWEKYQRIFYMALGAAALTLLLVSAWTISLRRRIKAVTRRMLRSEQELIQSERLAVIGKLAAGVAHEINNPLGIVTTNTDVMMKLTQDPALLARLEAMRHNLARASEITRRLLRLGVPVAPEFAAIDLAALLRESLQFLRPRLKEIKLDTDGVPDSLMIRGDRVLLEQLMLNLLLNALDSMDDKGELAVSAEAVQDQSKGFIKVSIRDSGKGIAPQDLGKIFDLFYTTRNREGFGVGLFVAKRIVDQHHGTIRAESEPCRGTIMSFTLPVDQA